MTPSESFPERTVVTSFLLCEETLTGVLRIVPWCEEHEHVWSPVLTTVIMEACTQLDSLWRYTAWLSRCVGAKKKERNDLGIPDYFRYFAKESLTPLGDRWVVFWGPDPAQIRPFQAWAGATTYAKLEWWDAYTSLKHDRLKHQKEGTLSAAVNATAGLFLGILSCGHCGNAVQAAGWLSARDSISHNPKASLGEDSSSVKDGYVLAETGLFSYPVGWCRAEVKENDDWCGNASFRFKQWFREYTTG